MIQKKERQLKNVYRAVTSKKLLYVSNLPIVLEYNIISTNEIYVIACDPKLMPTFPQHRNMKKAVAVSKENREQEPTTDQTNNLPAISDLVSNFVF